MRQYGEKVTYDKTIDTIINEYEWELVYQPGFTLLDKYVHYGDAFYLKNAVTGHTLYANAHNMVM